MKRKITAVLLCGILAISSLAGCGSIQGEEAEPAVVEEPTVEEETPVAEEEEEVTEEAEAEESEQEEEEKYLCLTQTDYNADGSVEALTKYIYNESGDTLKEITYDADGSITESTEYADSGFGWTTYDADGNEISSYLSEDEL